MNHHKKIILFLLFALPLLSVQCKKDNGDDKGEPKPQKGEVTFQFDHEVAGNALKYDTMIYTNQAGEEYEITKLEYIVTDFRFYKSDGSYEEFDLSQYINPQKLKTKSFTIGEIPSGNYSQVSFIFGVDSAKNQTGNLPNTQDFNNMAWMSNNGGGYHYMRMNGIHDSSGYMDGFTTHFGHCKKWDMSTQPPTQIGPLKDFSFEVKLANSSININGNSWKMTITMDLNKWYEDPNTYSFAALKNEGIMMNQSIQQTLMENGHNVFSLKTKSKE